MKKYSKIQLSALPASTVDKANASNITHNKGRKSFDTEFAIAIMDAQYRCELELKILANPDAKCVHWPEDNPVIGYVSD